MLQGLYAAASGMEAQQNQFNAISNDLSNLNTPGYQATEVGFQDLLYSGAGSASGTAPSRARRGRPGAPTASSTTCWCAGWPCGTRGCGRSRAPTTARCGPDWRWKGTETDMTDRARHRATAVVGLGAAIGLSAWAADQAAPARWWPWLALAAALLALELASFFSGPRVDHPTISSLYDSATRWRAVKAAFFVGWLCLGAALVRS